MVVETITNVDIFLISETKIDLAFANMQFKINRYKLFRRDRNRFGQRLMLDLNEEIPCKLLNTHLIVPTCRFSGCCILTGSALKLILYDFSSNFILNMSRVNFF